MLVSLASLHGAILGTVPPASAFRRASHRACPPPCSLPPSSWLTALTRRALPCVTGCSSLFGVCMSRVKFVEDDTAGTPTIDFALFVVVLWPSPHLSYPGEPGASRISAPGAIQTAGFVSPASPAPARSSRSNPGQLQDLTPTDPPHPPGPPYLPTPVGTRGRDGRRSRCAQPPPQVWVRWLCALESAGRPCGRVGAVGRQASVPCLDSGACEQHAQAARSVAVGLVRGHMRLLRAARVPYVVL